MTTAHSHSGETPDLIDGYVEELRRRGSVAEISIGQIGRNLRTIARDCAPLKSLSPDELQDWLDSRRKANGAPLSASTRGGYISSLNGFYAWAVDQGHRSDNPAAGIARPVSEAPTSHVITAGELERAIRNGSGDLPCWIMVAAYEGLKPQQVATLTREDVDLSTEPPVLRVRRRDGALDHVVELHPRVIAALEALPMPTEGRLFPAADAASVSRKINRLLRPLGIAARADDLRSWYGSEGYWRERTSPEGDGVNPAEEPLGALAIDDDVADLDSEASEDEMDSEPLVIDERTSRMLRYSLASRKAVVLIGPPGTGKTRLAQAVVREAAEDCEAFGLRRPPVLGLTVTPDESWTAAEIVGGATIYEGHVIFRPGHVLRAIEQDEWLLLDEANRGDLDKILGGLLTWLAEPNSDVVVGRLSEAPGAPMVTLGWGSRPECEVVHREWLENPLSAPSTDESVRFLAGQDWRLLATYNAVDAQRVFRFGQALGRRFATVPVAPLDVEMFASLVVEKVQDIPLPVHIGTQVAKLYSVHQSNPETVLGPAAFLKIPEYVASVVTRGEIDYLAPEELDDLVAEGYLVNLGHSLSRLEDQIELLGSQIQKFLGIGPWEWLRDQLPALG